MKMEPKAGVMGRIDISGWNFDTDGITKSYADWMQSEGMRQHMAHIFQQALQATFDDVPASIVLDMEDDNPLMCIVRLPLSPHRVEAKFSLQNLIAVDFLNSYKDIVTGKLEDEDEQDYARCIAKSLRELADVVERHIP